MKKQLAIVAMVLLTGCGYNTIQTMDEQVNQYKANIETQLQRRADLIPNLVETVKGVAAQEQEVFTAVADARSRLGGAIQTGDLEQMANANAGLNSALGRLLAISEAYPDLRSSQNFRDLQVQLEGTENRLATARTDYNQAVQRYNSYIRRFPAVLTAKLTGADAYAYFEAAEGAREAPSVNFN